MIDQISAGDVNALPLDVVADNFGQFVNTTLSIDQTLHLVSISSMLIILTHLILLLSLHMI